VGNARTFLVNHLMACQDGWRMRMRVEDLDGPRVKADATAAMLDDLAWLGLTWESPVVCQSERDGVYRDALDTLIELGAAYPCTCSRKDIEQAASAPHGDEAVAAYPGTCRDGSAQVDNDRPVAWRVRAPDGPIEVCDRFVGPVRIDLSQHGGDFVVFKNSGTAAYQLAVTVDDAAAGVDAVVRGRDLLDSAARQIHLRRLLGLTPEPVYWHLPLIVGGDGKRLAKRHGDTRLATYRRQGVSAERMLGLLGYLAGQFERPRETTVAELEACFDLAHLAREDLGFTDEHEAFLLASA